MDLMTTMKTHAKTDSWAVWETDSTTGELTGVQTFPSGTELDALHGRAVIVGLNPGGALGTPPPQNEPDWANFHATRGHNDIFLAHAFHRTRFWGAYMTDLHPDIRESKSQLVFTDSELVNQAVLVLVEKVKLLGTVTEIVCIGGRAHREITRRAEQIKDETGIPRQALHKITHYSGGQAGTVRKHKNDPAVYRELVHEELGL